MALTPPAVFFAFSLRNFMSIYRNSHAQTNNRLKRMLGLILNHILNLVVLQIRALSVFP